MSKSAALGQCRLAFLLILLTVFLQTCQLVNSFSLHSSGILKRSYISLNSINRPVQSISSKLRQESTTQLYGLADLLKGALANDPNLPPPTNPGLSKGPQPVTVEFLGANKKTVTAYLGQSISDIAKRAGVDIKYSCKKGECRTCEVNFNGKIVKACQSSLPATSRETKFTVGVPQKK